MAKANKVEVQKGEIKPRDFMSDNSKNLTPMQRAEMDYENRMHLRRGKELEYNETKAK